MKNCAFIFTLFVFLFAVNLSTVDAQTRHELKLNTLWLPTGVELQYEVTPQKRWGL